MPATATKHTPGPWTISDGYVWHTDEATGAGYRFKPIEFSGGSLAWVADDDGDSEAVPNARLIAAAPDHALYAAALTAKRIRWEFFTGDTQRGEICADGIRHSTELDEFGVPRLDDTTRAVLARVMR